MTAQQIPDAELEVLAVLWKRGQLSAREIREAMENYRPMTHAAVSTLLKRLGEKGLVKREKGQVGKAFLFQAAIPPRSTHRRIVKDLMQRVFADNGLALVSALFDTHPPSMDELDELQELLDKLRDKAAKSKAAKKGKRK